VSRFPWLGFSGSFGVLACAAAVSLVLIYSDGQVANDWDEVIKVSPNVLAVIFTTLANILPAGVVTQGAAIAWWRRALHATTIQTFSATGTTEIISSPASQLDDHSPSSLLLPYLQSW
jgi:hypothetical protein